jgi:hypothetical protein
MLIEPRHAEIFHSFYPQLLEFAQERLAVDQDGDTRAFASLRESLFQRPDLLDEFVETNACHLDGIAIDNIRAWRHAVTGEFVLERDLKPHTIFLETTSTPRAYGVLGLTTEFVDMLPQSLPVMAHAVLLPWGDRIISDGFLISRSILFGGGMKRSFRASYMDAKERGVLTSLPPVASASPKKRPSGSSKNVRRKRKKEAENDPKAAATESLRRMVAAFCVEYLDDEYQELADKLITKMNRKRQVPFMAGNLEGWAAGVLYALGQINFLFDASFQPHATADDFANHFGLSKGTISSRAKKIRDMFRLRYYSDEFCTERMRASNPMRQVLSHTLFL